MKRLIKLLQQIDEMGGLPEDEFEELINLLEKETEELKDSFEFQRMHNKLRNDEK